MKRTELSKNVGNQIWRFMDEVEALPNYYDLTVRERNELLGSKILNLLEEAGMLPPIQNPSLVEDTYHGGQKHGPALRVWDKEYDSGAEMDRQMAIGGQTYPAEVYASITKEEWEEAQAFDPEENS